jgi:hypothetical protein
VATQVTANKLTIARQKAPGVADAVTFSRLLLLREWF